MDVVRLGSFPDSFQTVPLAIEVFREGLCENRCDKRGLGSGGHWTMVHVGDDFIRNCQDGRSWRIRNLYRFAVFVEKICWCHIGFIRNLF